MKTLLKISLVGLLSVCTFLLISAAFFLFSLFNEIQSMDTELYTEMGAFKILSDSAWIELRALGSPKVSTTSRESAEPLRYDPRTIRVGDSFFRFIAGRAKREANSCTCVETANRCPAGKPGTPGVPGTPGQNGQPGRPGEPGRAGLVIVDSEGGCYICPPGPPGPAGTPGHPGTHGPPGMTGSPGPHGKMGEPGFDGQMGNPGEPGKDGPPGPPGKPGREAITARGSRGNPGPRGMRGSPGQPGHPGEPGMPGPQGPPGVPGREGPKGTPGYDGNQGFDGEDGDPGEDADYCPCPERDSPGFPLNPKPPTQPQRPPSGKSRNPSANNIGRVSQQVGIEEGDEAPYIKKIKRDQATLARGRVVKSPTRSHKSTVERKRIDGIIRKSRSDGRNPQTQHGDYHQTQKVTLVSTRNVPTHEQP